MTGEELRERYGKPEHFPAEEFLRLLPERPMIAGSASVHAFRYPGLEAAGAFAEANKRHGHESLGPVVTDDGVLGAVIVRPPGKGPDGD